MSGEARCKDRSKMRRKLGPETKSQQQKVDKSKDIIPRWNFKQQDSGKVSVLVIGKSLWVWSKVRTTKK